MNKGNVKTYKVGNDDVVKVYTYGEHGLEFKYVEATIDGTKYFLHESGDFTKKDAIDYVNFVKYGIVTDAQV